MASYYSDIPRHSLPLRYAMIAELTCGLCCMLYLLSPFRFWETPVVPHQSEIITKALYLFTLWLGIIILRKSISREYSLQLTFPDLLLLFYNIYLIILATTTGKPIDKELILGWLALGLSYLVLRMTKPGLLKYYLYLLPLALLLQMLYSIHTQLDFMTPVKHLHTIRGSFLNTGIWGGFTALCFLTCTGVACYSGNKVIKRISICCAVGSLILLFFSFSRAAWISAFVGLGYLLTYRYRKPLKAAGKKIKYILLLTAVCLSVLFIYSLGQYKTDSANGRLLIWQISAPMILEKPYFGFGIDGFRQHYMDYQQAYFRDRPDSRFNRLADDNPFAFNELLRIGIEQGTTGLLFIGILVCLLLKKEQEQDPVVTIARAGIVAFFIFGLFSYPTAVFQLKIVLLLFLAITASAHPCVVRANGAIVLPGTILILSCWGSIQYVPLYASALKQWNTALLSGSPGTTGAISQAPACLENSFMFQSTCGTFLNRNGNYTAAVKVLEKATSHYPSYQLTVELGKSYEALGEYDKAGQAWERAADMVPHKFTPGYLRAKMYMKTGQTALARQLAADLLHKKIKRVTPELHLILREMREILQTSIN